MRVDRFLEARFPGLSFSHIQRVIRKGELRVNGKRTQPKNRLEAGQTVRIPPLRLDAPKPRTPGSEADEKTREFLKSIMLYEDDDVLVFNKPMGLAVQGGSGTTRHLDGMLDVLRDATASGRVLCTVSTRIPRAVFSLPRRGSLRRHWQKPSVRVRRGRFIGRWLPVCQKCRKAASRPSSPRKSVKRSFMRIARHGDKGASHAVTYYAVVEVAGPLLAWISLKPMTRRTHQLRAHMAHIGHPIVGDPKDFSIENWELPGGMQTS